MRDLCAVLAALLGGYGAALAACGLAHLVIWVRAHGGRSRDAASAAVCALMPFLAVVSALFVAVARPEGIDPLHPSLVSMLHDHWHRWAQAVQAHPTVHAGLHLFNVALLLAIPVVLGRTLFHATRAATFARTLRGLPMEERRLAGAVVHVLPVDRAFCFVSGVRRPRIFVGQALLSALSPREAAAMVAHEAAHVRRRDPLMLAILNLLYALCPLPGGVRLVTAWVRTAERVCDEAAAQACGDRRQVAAALVRTAAVSRQWGERLPVACFVPRTAEPGELEARVAALLDLHPPAPGRCVRTCLFLTALVVALTVSLYPFLVHAAELLSHHE